MCGRQAYKELASQRANQSLGGHLGEADADQTILLEKAKDALYGTFDRIVRDRNQVEEGEGRGRGGEGQGKGRGRGEEGERKGRGNIEPVFKLLVIICYLQLLFIFLVIFFVSYYFTYPVEIVM